MQGTYDAGLVLLSVAVAMAASYAALALAARLTLVAGNAAFWWLVAGAFAMGAGIWSMHFIGMLAFKLPVRMAYDPWLTAVSMAVAVVTSGFALDVVSRLATSARTGVDLPVLAAGGAIMGAGIAAMHYTGMAAMRMAPPIVYDPPLFGLSIVIAVGASLAALWLAFTLRGDDRGRRGLFRLLAAGAMGLAISGMHYTAMAAAQFDPDAICTVSAAYEVDNAKLAYGIAGIALVILGLTVFPLISRARPGPPAPPP